MKLGAGYILTWTEINYQPSIVYYIIKKSTMLLETIQRQIIKEQ